MAQLGGRINLGVNRRRVAGRATASSQSTSGSNTALADKALENMKWILGAVVIALFVGIVLIVKNSFDEYSNIIRLYNDERNKATENRVKYLEDQVIILQ